ncbi:MAG: MarR family transcriptional regulator [Actinobacteria bacterium]|nr:MarR family transcriptional regulator [Actinomycetota bacterium]
MNRAADTEFVVLHALRLKGFAETDALAASLDQPVDVLADLLDRLAAAGMVLRRDGRVSGWALTPQGRVRHAREVAAVMADPERRARLADAYQRFLPLNRRALAVCTDWQMRTVDGRPVINDHDDRAYDASVVARLVELDAEAQVLCAELARIVDWFGGYGLRLANALARVQAGDFDWFTLPVIDSYHTVWFELHEDLLSTLGIERSKEEQS